MATLMFLKRGVCQSGLRYKGGLARWGPQKAHWQLAAGSSRSYAKKAASSEKEADGTKFEFLEPAVGHNLPDDGPATYCYSNAEELLKYYRSMFTIRRMEITADSLYKAKLIRGFLHLYNGQEAVCVGLEAALRKEDMVITAYRDHGFQYIRGDTPTSILAELLGKSTGCSRGRGGSMHMYHPEGHFYGGNGIVGAQVPLGLGLGFAAQYNNTDNIGVALMGDGAANQGQVYESFNMAALWKLPVMFIIENNNYAMGTAVERSTKGVEYFQRGDYIPGLKVDGMDVLAVKTAMEYATDYVRKNGPMVVEMNTYRYVGHSMSDPGTTYRSRAEIKQVRDTKDPIAKIKTRLIDNQLATKEEISALEKEVRAEISEAEKAARAAPIPDDVELYQDIYTDDVPVRGVELSNSYAPK